MTLKQIDQRFELYSDYLRYRIDNWWLAPEQQMRIFKETGLLFFGKKIMDYNQWLYQIGREDLVCYYTEPKIKFPWLIEEMRNIK